MSTKPPQHATERTTLPRGTDRSFALGHAQRTFEPTNRNPTPDAFTDKWAAADR
jgi:hypothetical protein